MKFEDAVSSLSNEAKDKIANCQNLDEILDVFRQNNIDISPADIKSAVAPKTGELSDDELANVTGGIDISYLIQEILKLFVKKIKD